MINKKVKARLEKYNLREVDLNDYILKKKLMASAKDIMNKKLYL